LKNDDHDSLVGALEAMANVCVKQQRYSEALNYMDRAINLREAVDQTDNALVQSLFNKLNLLDKMDRLESSLPELEDAERLIASLKPSYLTSAYFDQAAVYRCRLQRPELALQHWEKTHQILLAEYLSTHIVTAFARQKLAYSLFQIGQVDSAKEHLKAAYTVLRTRLGGQHEDVQALAAAQADPQTMPAVLEKWSLMTLTEIDKQPLPDKSAELLHMLVGLDIVSIFDPDKGSQVVNRIGKARFALLDQENFLLPNIRIMDSTNIPKQDYILQLNGQEIFRARLPTHYAIASPGGKGPSILSRKITQEIGFSFPLLWIDEESELPAGTRMYNAEEVIMANLVEIIKQKKDLILAAIQ
jgi:tetratricopeptide (TPR) repeat protein